MEFRQQRYFPDHCNHDESEYVGSVSYFRRVGELVLLDVYVWSNSRGQDVCIRYGDEGHQYISAGSLWDFLCSDFSALTDYQAARATMMHYGRLNYAKTN